MTEPINPILRPDADHDRRNRVLNAAATLGFHDPADAWALLAGEPLEDPEEAVQRLAMAKPHLTANGAMNNILRRVTRAEDGNEPPLAFGARPVEPAWATGSADGGNPGEPSGGISMGDLIRQDWSEQKFGR